MGIDTSIFRGTLVIVGVLFVACKDVSWQTDIPIRSFQSSERNVGKTPLFETPLWVESAPETVIERMREQGSFGWQSRKDPGLPLHHYYDGRYLFEDKIILTFADGHLFGLLMDSCFWRITGNRVVSVEAILEVDISSVRTQDMQLTYQRFCDSLKEKLGEPIWKLGDPHLRSRQYADVEDVDFLTIIAYNSGLLSRAYHSDTTVSEAGSDIIRASMLWRWSDSGGIWGISSSLKIIDASPKIVLKLEVIPERDLTLYDSTLVGKEQEYVGILNLGDHVQHFFSFIPIDSIRKCPEDARGIIHLLSRLPDNSSHWYVYNYAGNGDAGEKYKVLYTYDTTRLESNKDTWNLFGFYFLRCKGIVFNRSIIKTHLLDHPIFQLGQPGLYITEILDIHQADYYSCREDFLD